jgi:hypothetical protein
MTAGCCQHKAELLVSHGPRGGRDSDGSGHGRSPWAELSDRGALGAWQSTWRDPETEKTIPADLKAEVDGRGRARDAQQEGWPPGGQAGGAKVGSNGEGAVVGHMVEGT